VSLLSLLEADRQALHTLVRAASTPQAIAQRAQILLTAAEPDSHSDRQVADTLGVHHTTVHTWCTRFVVRRAAHPDGTVRHLLADAPRSGRPLEYGPDARMVIVVMACQPPEDSSQWSIRDLTAAVHAETTLRPAASTVWTILDEAAVKPHKHTMWLNSRDPEFATKQQAITDLYRELPRAGRLILSLDEKTGIQAKEQLGPPVPTRPGYPARTDYEYKRHGTLSLLAALEVRTGKVYGATFPHHTQVEFVAFLERLDAHYDATITDIVAICDNLAVHKTARVRDWLADHPRWRLVFTPTHASWLNQIEIWFGILQRKLIRRGQFVSVADLAAKLAAFIAAYNRRAHPFRWTYTGKPLAE
jgi:transposase